ncbi:MAG: indolepyruvate oxidoreductase subunit beta [Bacillota bacterium]|nr:indolepyruvate oxidoreductase subunit beta [Thermoanaerobacteraceae bacterium]
MRDVTGILIAGVGGQGIILAGKLAAQAAILGGMDVKTSEIHGMAQRGGSVVTHVRFGPKVFAPVIDSGGADFLLAFEKLEGLRNLKFLRPGGTVILNDQVIEPLPVLLGKATYPADVVEQIGARFPLLVINALAEAEGCGDTRTANVVLLGALAHRLPFPRSVWEEALRAVVPARFLELNRRAFARGFEIAASKQPRLRQK